MTYLFETNNSDDGAGDHDRNGRHEYGVKYLVFT